MPGTPTSASGRRAVTGDWNYLADAAIREQDLSFELYNRSADVKDFDCGNAGLNGFLHSPDEVADYHESGLGKTTLVYSKGCLVGFFTLCNDGLELKYVDAKKMRNQFKRRQKEIIKTIPSIKIGRFATDKRVERRGVGTFMLRHIVGLALASESIAVRLIILEAYPDPQGFYLQRGFQFTEEKDRERGKRNRTMFFDLDEVRDVA